jgi:hypothetical protein
MFYQQVIGKVKPPAHLGKFGTVEGGAIGSLLQVIFNILIIGGGIYALFNFILAGYSFLSAGDDPQKVTNAWKKIWQSIIGLLFLVGAFVLGAIIGILIYGDATALISPSIPTP